MSSTRIDLNADVGEGDPSLDEHLFPLITSANIACGGHSGDDESMLRTVRLALAYQTRIGAHPSYPDREHFGRLSMDIKNGDLFESIVEQIEALIAIASTESVEVAYIKPHGALYIDAAMKSEVASVVGAAAQRFGLPVMMLAGSPAASRPGIIKEGFIDRAYDSQGMLLPRSIEGALISSASDAAAQAISLASFVDSLCVHSDTPSAHTLLRAARRALIEAGYEIAIS